MGAFCQTLASWYFMKKSFVFKLVWENHPLSDPLRNSWHAALLNLWEAMFYHQTPNLFNSNTVFFNGFLICEMGITTYLLKAVVEVRCLWGLSIQCSYLIMLLESDDNFWLALLDKEFCQHIGLFQCCLPFSLKCLYRSRQPVVMCPLHRQPWSLAILTCPFLLSN